jgi:hypothetical protein
MAHYTYTSTTEQSATGHPNKVAALKVEIGGSPEVVILDQTTAAAGGAFTLAWGSDSPNANENWAGRVVILAMDDDGAVQLDCVAHDWRVGTPI